MLVHSVVSLAQWYRTWPWWEPGLVSEGILILPLLLTWPFWGFKWAWNVLNRLVGLSWAILFLLYGLWFVCHQSVLSGVGVGMLVVVGVVGVRFTIRHQSIISKTE